MANVNKSWHKASFKWKDFELVKMKDQALSFKREDNYKLAFKKNLILNHYAR